MIPAGSLGHWAYLPCLLIWALPVIAVQWLLGGRYLWRERRVWPWVALGLCLYFTLADAIAIAAGAWSFDRRALTGLMVGPVPIEEVLFYLLTALMCTQGFVTLWFGYEDRAQLRLRARERLARLTRRAASLSLAAKARGARGGAAGQEAPPRHDDPSAPAALSSVAGPSDGR